MDTSFLFQPEVIAASRKFICVRLVTYENKDEAPFLKWLTRTRSGEVENSSFGVLSPDAKTKLVFATRGINDTFRDAKAMATGMATLSEQYPSKSEPSSLPLAADIRIGIDVAAADSQPLVLLVAKNESARAALESTLAKLAWSPAFVGRFIYASTTNPADLATLEGASAASSLLVIQPDRFGLKGKVIAQAATSADFAPTLSLGLKNFARIEKSTPTQVRDGRRLGIFWQTKTPVTDPQELNARERTRAEMK